MASTYTLETKRRAFDLLCGGQTKSAICERPDMPSRVTLDKWIASGEFTDGTPWDDWIERKAQNDVALSRERALRERAEKGDDFLQEVKDLVTGDMWTAVRAKIVDHDFDIDAKSITEMVKLFAMLDNQASEKLEFAAWLIREIMQIAGEVMDKPTYSRFAVRLKTLEHVVNIKLNPLQHSEATKALM